MKRKLVGANSQVTAKIKDEKPPFLWILFRQAPKVDVFFFLNNQGENMLILRVLFPAVHKTLFLLIKLKNQR